MTPRTRKRIPAKPQDTKGISTRAMLVCVTMSAWSGSKCDHEVTNDALTRYKATAGSGRFQKILLGAKIPEMARIASTAHALRRVLQEHTLPWCDEGWRLLPTMNYMVAMSAIRTAVQDRREAVETFLRRYDELRNKAAASLGDMYHPDDYPAREDLQAYFSCEIGFSPLPISDDLRITLPAADLEKAKEVIQRRITQSLEASVKELWQRLGEVVEALHHRLAADGKHLRESMVEKIKDTAQALGRLNVTNDPDLEAMRTRVLQELVTSALVLKENEPKRAEVAKKAADIMKAMSAFYTPPKDEKKGEAR